jgi:hypothetical protein
MPRKKTLNPYNYYNPTDEDTEAFLFCVRNNIRISIVPQERGMDPRTFKVSICLGPYKRGEKVNLSPNTYSIEQIIEEKYKAMRYYYEKYKRGI